MDSMIREVRRDLDSLHGDMSKCGITTNKIAQNWEELLAYQHKKEKELLDKVESLYSDASVHDDGKYFIRF